MERPKVGMGVAVMRDGKVLVQKRINAHGHGTWCFPGGHLEFGESLEDCAKRETLEEAGVRIRNVRFATVTNDVHRGDDEGKHYITLIMVAEWESGEARVMEPGKAEAWKWVEWDDVPRPLFLSMENLVGQGFRPEQFLTSDG